MCSPHDFDHLMPADDAEGITDHVFDPSYDGIDAYCLTCSAKGWTTLAGDHASLPEDTLCPNCGQDDDPNFGGCECYGSPDDRARFIIAERSRLLSLSGLPLVEDALAFALSLR